MKPFVVRTCLLIDFLFAIPVFIALIFVSPDKYADVLAESGATIRGRIRYYRGEEPEPPPTET